MVLSLVAENTWTGSVCETSRPKVMSPDPCPVTLLWLLRRTSPNRHTTDPYLLLLLYPFFTLPSFHLEAKSHPAPSWCHRGLAHAQPKHLLQSAPSSQFGKVPARPHLDHRQPHHVVHLDGSPSAFPIRCRAPVTPWRTIIILSRPSLLTSGRGCFHPRPSVKMGRKLVPSFRHPGVMAWDITLVAADALTRGVPLKYIIMAWVDFHLPSARIVGSSMPAQTAAKAPATLMLWVPKRALPSPSVMFSPASRAMVVMASRISLDVIRLPSCPTNRGVVPSTLPIFCRAIVRSVTWSHNKWAGHMSSGSSPHVHSRATISPWPSWSVLEALTQRATSSLPPLCFFSTSSTFSAASSPTLRRYQIPVATASK